MPRHVVGCTLVVLLLYGIAGGKVINTKYELVSSKVECNICKVIMTVVYLRS